MAGAEVKVPETVREWQIYDQPGARRAARALTAALRRALSRMEAALDKGYRPEKVAEDAWRSCLHKVMLRYRDLGTFDTEPRAVVRGVMRALCHSKGFELDGDEPSF